MNIQLINGHFTPEESLDLITQMIHAKIKFQENKIHKTSNEEDIKMREKRIKELQQNLYEAGLILKKSKTMIDLKCSISLS